MAKPIKRKMAKMKARKPVALVKAHKPGALASKKPRNYEATDITRIQLHSIQSEALKLTTLIADLRRRIERLENPAAVPAQPPPPVEVPASAPV